MKDGRQVIGISLGEVNGIGPELVLKTFSNPQLLKLCIPVVYGPGKALNFYKNLYNHERFGYQQLQQASQANDKRLNLIDTSPEFEKVEPGVASEKTGLVAYQALERAVADLKAGSLDALVTLPIDKYTIQNPSFQFAGHTEYLAAQFGNTQPLMLMVHEQLRVALASIHVPLREVAGKLTTAGIVAKLRLINDTLKMDFGISKPRIAVLGLNPHAGDKGLIGKEEQDIIQPALDAAKQDGLLVMGPYPADGFFAAGTYKKFDITLAMYHDQGLIPFKTLCEGHGVNYTGGLPVIRTSPDHGTAYDIAGRDAADDTSFRQAIYLAIDAHKQRSENKTLLKNALGNKPLPAMFRSAEDEVLRTE